MNPNQLYKRAVGKDKEETGADEFTALEQHIKLNDFNEWRKLEQTKAFFGYLESNYNLLIDAALNQAGADNKKLATKNLVKAKLLKEIIKYGN